MRFSPHRLLPCVIVSAITLSLPAATVEDPVARAALPEYKSIPAAKPDDLTPAAALDLSTFAHWPRSQGDNGARRYSTLKQITRENVRELEVAWTYRSGDGAVSSTGPVIAKTRRGFSSAPAIQPRSSFRPRRARRAGRRRG